MTVLTAAAANRRSLLERHRDAIEDVLDRYGATGLRVFGSVARGDARDDSDLDLLVNLSSGQGNELMRLAGLGEELSELLGVEVDVVAPDLLRAEIAESAMAGAVPL